MLMMIAFLFVYFALLTRMKHLVEVNRKYNKVVQMPVSQVFVKNDTQKNVKQEIIDQLQSNYKIDYIHLIERI
jgi:uncharacterized alpha/beta hydrolase family protein